MRSSNVLVDDIVAIIPKAPLPKSGSCCRCQGGDGRWCNRLDSMTRKRRDQAVGKDEQLYRR